MREALFEEISGGAWFDGALAPYLVVDRSLRIRAVNLAYEHATGHSRKILLGEFIFDVFPNNPDDPEHDGVGHLARSFETVLRDATPHWMGLQRYDVRDLDHPTAFVQKVWTPRNHPLRLDGRVEGILHHVEDVTELFDPASPKMSKREQTTREMAFSLWSEFAELSYGQVLGVLAHSRRIVYSVLGACDTASAKSLAITRLEVMAKRPRRDVSIDDHEWPSLREGIEG